MTDPNTDWLVNPAGYISRVHLDPAQHELIIENGLAKRVMRLQPNAATVAIDNLTNGQTLLRAVGPEAHIGINGTVYAIGGLSGQPIANYLRREWVDRLHDDPLAYHYSGWREEPIQARFPWKKHPEWLSKDLAWPPHGRHVVMRYAPPSLSPEALNGPVLLQEPFGGALSAEWSIHLSPKHPDTSFAVNGHSGSIVALPETAAYAEHPWPATAEAIELTVAAPQDDHSNSWGPGIALVCADHSYSFVARPESGQYEVDGGVMGELVAGRFDRSRPATLRIRLNRTTAIFEASQEGALFQTIGQLDLPQTPKSFRVGKVGKFGRGTDTASAQGAVVACQVSNLLLRGPSNSSSNPRTDLPLVEVHYEIYDGLPLFCKWLVVKNNTGKPINIDSFVSEEIRLTEPESNVEAVPDRERPDIWVETDYAFGAMDAPHAAAKAVSLESDPDYPTQVNYDRKTPCLLKCKPPIGPNITLPAGQRFESFRAFELLLDSTERERRGLAQRRMYRTIAPWTAENPLMFHLRNADPTSLHNAIDQAHRAGFEMIIMSFGSGFNFESRDPNYIAKYKTLADEARSKGIALGGYSLLASRGAATAADNTQGQPAMYGTMPCLGATWGIEYLQQLKHFISDADLTVLEHDGSYPGDRCASTEHPGHKGLEDSQWVMWRAITDLYKWCRGNGVYLNIPDWYFLNGGNKCGMGYRESNWSLPRAEQEIIERQNIFDGTWTKTGSMGWMMVPLTEYQGGGAAATIEPLHEHLDHYEARLANLIGAGVQACYRGPRLFDTDGTLKLVSHWTTFYKAHRQVLDGDMIHLRRANGRDWDGWLHVNAAGEEKGLAFLYNPLAEPITRTVKIPLHYTGLTGHSLVSINGGKSEKIALSADNFATIKVTIPGRGRVYLIFK